MDCSAFLNWNEEILKSESEKVVVFRSLVATVKFQPVFDASLEAKAVKFLESLDPENLESSDAFLSSLRQISDDSLTNFVQCIGVLISSSYQVITSRAMAMLRWLLTFCSDRNILILVKADLVPRLINTLNPLSLSTTEQVYVHTNLIQIISNSLSPSTPYGLKNVAIKDGSEQQAVLETILKQVLVPSGKYICHLCVNRFSIVDGDQSTCFLILLARILLQYPYYQPTMDFVLHMPVVLTIPSCLTFFETERSIFHFLNMMVHIQRDCKEKLVEQRQIWKERYTLLRMEGIEDVIDERLQNDKSTFFGRSLVADSIGWSTLQGMNLPKYE